MLTEMVKDVVASVAPVRLGREREGWRRLGEALVRRTELATVTVVEQSNVERCWFLISGILSRRKVCVVHVGGVWHSVDHQEGFECSRVQAAMFWIALHGK